MAELEEYDPIIVSCPTRLGRMPSQMASFIDQGGQEVTLFSIITNLMHFGMKIVGLSYCFQGQLTLDATVGGSRYGATTMAGGKVQRQPRPIELGGARFKDKSFAKTENKLLS